MTLRKIARAGHPVLRQRAGELQPEALATAEVQRLIDDMVETMRDAGGAGIAAPQVHEPVRIAVLEVRANRRYPGLPSIPLTVLVNPVLTALVGSPGAPLDERDAVTMYEGCLSVPGLRGRVRRPRRVSVTALDRHGHELRFAWEGLASSVVQHECDHLDGVLFIDRAEPGTLMFLDEYEQHVPLEERMIDGGLRARDPG